MVSVEDIERPVSPSTNQEKPPLGLLPQPTTVRLPPTANTAQGILQNELLRQLYQRQRVIAANSAANPVSPTGSLPQNALTGLTSSQLLALQLQLRQGQMWNNLVSLKLEIPQTASKQNQMHP